MKTESKCSNAGTASGVAHSLVDLLDNPKISLVGCGGAGSRIVAYLQKQGLDVETIVVNTDKKNSDYTNVTKNVMLGNNITYGDGARGDPGIGAFCAETNREILKEVLSDTHIAIVVAGMGQKKIRHLDTASAKSLNGLG